MQGENVAEKIAILDPGAQYGKVLDRRVRELGVESDLLPMDVPAGVLRDYKGMIVAGSHESVYDDHAQPYGPKICSAGIPVLGICFGMQLENYACGGTVTKHAMREDGPGVINIEQESLLFRGLARSQNVLFSHGDSVDRLAEGFIVTARSDSGLVAAIEDPARKMYGVQFHPEVDLTEHGKHMLRNFLYDIAGCTGTYTMENRQQKAIGEIRQTVGDKDVLVLVSGGVDSTVCATLLVDALGPQRVYALHIDNGLMRLDESRKVAVALRSHGLELRVVDAATIFYHSVTTVNGRTTLALRDTTVPEDKRHIIGDTFMRVADVAMQSLGRDPAKVYLAQGTLRPDLIESASKLASGNADAIKTHHNDTTLVRQLRESGRIIEPLKDYHKDEVRELGSQLGLPEEIIWRQPFPGPGLGVRIICADKPYVTDAFAAINRQLQSFVPEGINATLLPIRTVGVQGDGRSYSYLTGLSGKRNWDELFRIARAIPKQVHGVNRIAYIFGDPVEGPVTEITPTYLREDAIQQLQHADDIVNQVLLTHGLIRTLSQVPVVLFPVHFGSPGNRSIGIRTFITNDFMTGVPAVPGREMPEEALDLMVGRILNEVPGITRVAYDLTSKPPGTTEWE